MDNQGSGKSGSQFALQWNGYESHLTSGMKVLLSDESLADVTLACDGKYLRAHKLVLSLCSPYFKTLFELHTLDRGGTVVILNNVKFKDLENILHYVYTGQVQVHQADLNSFLQTGEVLQVEGLAPNASDSCTSSTGSANLPTSSSGHTKQTKSSQSANRHDESSEGLFSTRLTRSQGLAKASSSVGVAGRKENEHDLTITRSSGPAETDSDHSEKSMTNRNSDYEHLGRNHVMDFEAEPFPNPLDDPGAGEEEREVIMVKGEAVEVLDINYDTEANHANDMHMDSSDYLADPIAVPSTSANATLGSNSQTRSIEDSSRKPPQRPGVKRRQSCSRNYNIDQLKALYDLEPGKCPICYRPVSRKRNLAQHVKDLHAIEKFKCEVCGFTFSRKYRLEVHLKSAHS